MCQVSQENQFPLLFLYTLAFENLCLLHTLLLILLLVVFFFSVFLYQHIQGSLAIMETACFTIRVFPLLSSIYIYTDARIISSSLSVSSPIETPRTSRFVLMNCNNYFLSCNNSDIILAVFSAPLPLKFFENSFTES